ncbi:polyphosphate polymerase domain-containing protein [Marinobacter sp.]|uniref:polyphosphate polymerase domain-containing protein n=1 Tax=Marinobacter sp. TaxID=50741 RepID=UPI003563E882
MNMAVAGPLDVFGGHSLADQMQARLMNRVDTKFMVPTRLLGTCLRGLEHDYTMLEIEGSRRFTYDTLYFDTPGRRLYLDHHNGKLNRYKLRIRHYRETGASFLEVKKKSNRARTIKNRLLLTSKTVAENRVFPFLEAQLGQPAAGMLPALFVGYRRVTLMNAPGTERITLDTALAFHSADRRCGVNLPEIAIVEVKYDRKVPFSPFLDRLGQLGCRPVQFSKYCVGTGLLFGHEYKTNRFKPLLRSLHGICS